ncbi:hypothetical protein GCM10023143_03240 [Compostibacter hankyongensis]|uniref:Uncharacterized protein n=2 Tax=Compostibacter hankyongensis TaxID=1007089 RepID=A0ABP8FDW3_9BACT
MKRLFAGMVLILLVFCSSGVMAQGCAMCSKTASELGEGAAKGLNTGILYLAAMPLAIAGFIGFRWWKNNQAEEGE